MQLLFDEAILIRLAAKSEVVGECLVWTGLCNADGYGRTKIGGRQGREVGIHRAAWICRHGFPPPETPLVLHTCDNPPCWRDEHLFLGTHADNMEDKRLKGRATQHPCEDAPGAKLTNTQVLVIKWRLMAGETHQSIANDYNVSKVAISHIWRGRNWAEVPWPNQG